MPIKEPGLAFISVSGEIIRHLNNLGAQVIKDKKCPSSKPEALLKVPLKSHVPCPRQVSSAVSYEEHLIQTVYS